MIQTRTSEELVVNFAHRRNLAGKCGGTHMAGIAQLLSPHFWRDDYFFTTSMKVGNNNLADLQR